MFMRRHDFKKLKVWQDAMLLVKDIYDVTKTFPKDETFGLTQQIRRSAISIPSNIAEGCGRATDAQLKHFLDIAQGSAFEAECQLRIATMLGYLGEEKSTQLENHISEIQKMIDGLSQRFQ
jgi:four helix bundle protein